MSAACLQDELAALLVAPHAASHAALHAAPQAVPALGAVAVGLASIAPARLSVHRNTFVSTLVEMLSESFPVTSAVLGADFFQSMARTCVLERPPSRPDLSQYASDFPDFIARYSPVAAMPFIAELAQLEALRLRAFHAADAEPLGRDAFLALAAQPERFADTTVTLHPAAFWQRARHAIHGLWSLHDRADDMSGVDLASMDLARPQDVLVCRPAFELRVTELPPGALDLLEALAKGACLADAFAYSAASEPRADTAANFALLLEHGLVTDLHCNPDSGQQDSA